MSRARTSASTGGCARRPHPHWCDTCPVMAWPYGGASPAAMRDFTDHARCPWDHPGGPVAWDSTDTDN